MLIRLLTELVKDFLIASPESFVPEEYSSVLDFSRLSQNLCFVPGASVESVVMAEVIIVSESEQRARLIRGEVVRITPLQEGNHHGPLEDLADVLEPLLKSGGQYPTVQFFLGRFDRQLPHERAWNVIPVL